MRHVLFLILFLHSALAQAMKPPPECFVRSDEDRAEFVKRMFEESDLVLDVGESIEWVEGKYTKREVISVWKGDIGQYVFVKGLSSKGIAFANYESENNVSLNSYFLDYCGYLNDLLLDIYGKPNPPDKYYFYRNHASALVIWSLMFILIITVLINAGVFKWVRNGT